MDTDSRWAEVRKHRGTSKSDAIRCAECAQPVAVDERMTGRIGGGFIYCQTDGCKCYGSRGIYLDACKRNGIEPLSRYTMADSIDFEKRS